jgi:hypothetical protein
VYRESLGTAKHVCGADEHWVQRLFRYSNVCVVQVYIVYRGCSGTAMCVHVVQVYSVYREISGTEICMCGADEHCV